MKSTVESFMAEAKKCKNPSDIDALAISWLRLVCTGEGTDGDRACKLLEVVGELLGI